ncbi:tetratricopeptide repeat protein [Dokdonia sp. PRO95]|uniref:tetratricopeptide repeat protein n=1 Tax=Dokdonia sp. PRO95 TaxID=1239415 RepID=UPI00055979BF|nr:tetratricopeptide repeat protein [Dokdonia sp. PRO95]
MRNLNNYLVVTVFMLTAIFTTAQTPEQLFEQGNSHYANGQFQEAIDTYGKVLDANQESAAIYYNLANAHFKLNNVAPSIYYYEKAKQLAPADQEIKNNASFAEKMTIDAITPLPENTFKTWYNSVLTLLTTDGWAYATVIFAALCTLLFLGYYFTASSTNKRALFVSSLVSLVLAICSLLFAYSAFAKISKDNPAIVFAKESQVKGEPTLSSQEAFLLHEGTKIMVLETVDNWKKILLADGRTGWIPTTDIREL